jgi:flagellar basal-body rod protein FlgC
VADNLKAAMASAVSALNAQSTRLRVLSENLANANVTAARSGGDPYVRKTITFKEEIDRVTGAATLSINKIGNDRAPFRVEFDPGHPAADETGNVKLPNVNPLVELADMREAHRSYEANLQVVRQTREMAGELLDLLRNK